MPSIARVCSILASVTALLVSPGLFYAQGTAPIRPNEGQQKVAAIQIGDQALKGISEVTLTAGGTLAIMHDDGVLRVDAKSIPAEFLNSWGIKMPEPPRVPALASQPAPQEAEPKVENKEVGHYTISYDVTIKERFSGESIEKAAPGNVSLIVGSPETVQLLFFNLASPANRNPKYRAQFPAQGSLEFPETAIPQVIKVLETFLEWDQKSAEHGLEGVQKEIGTVNGRVYFYVRSEFGQSWCSTNKVISAGVTYDDLMESKITIFVPAAKAALRLLANRPKYIAETNTIHAGAARMQARADTLLQAPVLQQGSASTNATGALREGSASPRSLRFDGNITTLSIDSTVGDFVLTSSASPVLEITNETDPTQVDFAASRDGGEVRLSVKNKETVTINPGRVMVKLPVGCSIEAKSMNGNYDISGFRGDKLHVHTMSGNVRSTEMGGSSTRLESISGSVRAAGRPITGLHAFRSVSGDVLVNLAANSSAKMSATSEKGLATIRDRRAVGGKVEDVIGGGAAVVSVENHSANAEVVIMK